MVLRVAIGEVVHPMSGASIALADPGRTAFLVRRISPERELTETFEVEYPTGRLSASSTDVVSGQATSPIPLDLDGDGIEDRIFTGQGYEAELVRVLSGADGAILFEYVDESEYFYGERVFSLGDLDNDGFGELALLHPRRVRSYDMAPAFTDSLAGVTSWVTVISGSRLRSE
jgi:hypothetical protein